MENVIMVPSVEIIEEIEMYLPWITEEVKDDLIELCKISRDLLDVIEVGIADFIDRYIDTDIVDNYVVTNIDTFTPHTTCQTQKSLKEYIRNTVGPQTCEYCEIDFKLDIVAAYVAVLHMRNRNDPDKEITATSFKIVRLDSNKYYLIDSLGSDVK